MNTTSNTTLRTICAAFESTTLGNKYPKKNGYKKYNTKVTIPFTNLFIRNLLYIKLIQIYNHLKQS